MRRWLRRVCLARLVGLVGLGDEIYIYIYITSMLSIGVVSAQTQRVKTGPATAPAQSDPHQPG
jgi:hypothetical protein